MFLTNALLIALPIVYITDAIRIKFIIIIIIIIIIINAVELK